MPEKIFWGEKGTYGPFMAQEDGWPNAGEVIRHYRRKLSMSAEELAVQYGEATGTQVTARWILKMEQQNKVPADITRRRILTQILDIPPILLGLALLEQITSYQDDEVKVQSAPVLLKKTPAVDIAKYDQYVRTRWLLSYTGEESLEEVIIHMRILEELERQSNGNLQRHVRNVLNSYYQLASDITRHQRNFSEAWFYGNNAVRVTKLIGVNDLFAAALYRRGYINLEWAIFGDKVALVMMNHEPERKKIEAAIVDFEMALLYARPQLKGAIWLELGRSQGILKNIPTSLRLVGMAEDMVGAGSNLADPVDQILLEGALNGLSEGMYLLGKAASLIAIGRTTTALELLDDLDELRNGKGIARNQARRLAYADILRAEASLGAKDHLTSAIRAESAFKTLRDIHTVEKIAWVHDIYRRLTVNYGNQSEVKNLGRMLTEYKHTLSSAKYR